MRKPSSFFNQLTNRRWKLGLVFIFILSLGFWLESNSFFDSSSVKKKQNIKSINQSELSNQKRINSAFAGESKSPFQTDNETLSNAALSTHSSSAAGKQATASYQWQFSNKTHPSKSTEQKLFPKKWLFSAARRSDISTAILQRLKNELDWPSDLSINHFYPSLKTRQSPSGREELFVNYEIKIRGFVVPQSRLRVMLFSDDNKTYQMSFVDHRFQLPPQEDFSVRVSKSEAIARVRQSENSKASTWKTAGVWRFSNNQWKPTWKIQLLDSPKTYYIDVRNGQQEKDHTELGASDSAEASAERSSTSDSEEGDILLVGMATPELGEPKELTALPLPGITARTFSQSILTADALGYLKTNQPVKALSFSLANSFVEVNDAKDLIPSYQTENSPVRKVTFNPEKTTNQTAMLNAYIYLNRAHDFLVNTLGFEAKALDKLIKAKVNSYLQICNANYRNGMVTFYEESEECRNTAFDTAIYHEYAHFVDDLYGGISDIALSEGMGDVLATFMTDQPLIGQKLYKRTLAPMRSAENNVLFFHEPRMGDSLRHTQYQQAQAWSGFAWKARQALIEKYGPSTGKELAQALFLTPLETNAADIPSAVAEVFARDAQGKDLAQSPNFELLRKAAQQHNLDFFTLSK